MPILSRGPSRPSSPARPVSSSQNISRPSSAFLDPHVLLPYGGPWGLNPVNPGSRPPSAAATQFEKMPLSLCGGMPSVVVKVQRWGIESLRGDEYITPSSSPPQRQPSMGSAQASRSDNLSAGSKRSHRNIQPGIIPRATSNLSAGSKGDNNDGRSGEDRPRSRGDDERPRSRGTGRHSMSVFAGSAAGAHGNVAAMARNWTAPSLSASGASGSGGGSTGDPLGKKAKMDVVSSVSTYIIESKRIRLQMNNFIKNRFKDDQDGNRDVGLNDLNLFHCQAARTKHEKLTRKKRPPSATKLRKQPLHDSDVQSDNDAAGGSGHAATTNVQKLCGILRKDGRDHERHMNDIHLGHKARRGSGLAMTLDAARPKVEAQFANAMRAKDNSVEEGDEVVAGFVKLILFLLEEWGSLTLAMQHVDAQHKMRLRRDQFEAGLEHIGYAGKSHIMAKIFAVLDQDNDGEITHADVACYEPPKANAFGLNLSMGISH